MVAARGSSLVRAARPRHAVGSRSAARASMPAGGDGREQSQHGIDRVLRSDDADLRRGRGVAGERDMESWTFAGRGGAQPDIGGNRVETDAPAAVDHHGDFRRERERGLGDGMAQRRGDRLRARSERWGRPGSGSQSTGTLSQRSMPRASTAAANSGAETALSPRTCRLPRALISMMPLPCMRARVAEADERIEGDRACRRPVARAGRRRSASGADNPGQAPRAKALLIAPPPLGSGSGPRRDRCGADATVPCAAPPPAVGDGAGRSGVLAQQEIAHARVGEIGLMHADRTARSTPRRSSRRNRPAGRPSRRARLRRARRAASGLR